MQAHSSLHKNKFEGFHFRTYECVFLFTTGVTSVDKL